MYVLNGTGQTEPKATVLGVGVVTAGVAVLLAASLLVVLAPHKKKKRAK